MSSHFRKIGLSAAAFVLLAVGAARAVEVGPYFPLPNYFDLKGKEELLEQQVSWLKDGVAAVQKARGEIEAKAAKAEADPALQNKLKELDALKAAAEKELAILANDAGDRETELARKDVVITNINRWINALARKATEQLKIAILKDGLERDAAERQHIQLSGQADELERAKHQSSVEAWGR
jgi:hypothetical protein